MSLFGAIDVDGEGDGDWVARVSPAAILETFDSYDASSPLTGSTKNGDLKHKLFDKQAFTTARGCAASTKPGL